MEEVVGARLGAKTLADNSYCNGVWREWKDHWLTVYSNNMPPIEQLTSSELAANLSTFIFNFTKRPERNFSGIKCCLAKEVHHISDECHPRCPKKWKWVSAIMSWSMRNHCAWKSRSTSISQVCWGHVKNRCDGLKNSVLFSSLGCTRKCVLLTTQNMYSTWKKQHPYAALHADWLGTTR